MAKTTFSLRKIRSNYDRNLESTKKYQKRMLERKEGRKDERKKKTKKAYHAFNFLHKNNYKSMGLNENKQFSYHNCKPA